MRRHNTLVLVINAGSSSLKYQLIDVDSETTLVKGLIERVTDHGAALRLALDQIESVVTVTTPAAPPLVPRIENVDPGKALIAVSVPPDCLLYSAPL